MALHMGMTIEQLANVDLTYAPPFSPPIDNVSQTANVLRNKLDGSYVGDKGCALSSIKTWCYVALSSNGVL